MRQVLGVCVDPLRRVVAPVNRLLARHDEWHIAEPGAEVGEGAVLADHDATAGE